MATAADLVRILVKLEIILIFARVLLSWFPGIPPWHPLVRLLASVTDPVLMPFRRLVPSIGGLDFSPIIAIVVIQIVGDFVIRLLLNSEGSVATSLTLGLHDIVYDILVIIMIIVGLRIVLSVVKVSPFNPAARLISDVSTPLVRPFAGLAARQRQAVDVPAIVALVFYLVVWYAADHLLLDLARSTVGV